MCTTLSAASEKITEDPVRIYAIHFAMSINTPVASERFIARRVRGLTAIVGISC
jgi:hypothetical protein